MESKNICPICLRTNRKLKVIPSALSEYHDELTNYSLPLKNTLYCSECECLLRKTYNFHQKCTNAAKVLKNWMNTTTKEKLPANMLHLKLPLISLSKWTSKNTKVFNFTWTDYPETTVLIKESVLNKPETDTLLELNMSEKLNRETSIDEDIKSIIHTEREFKTETDYQCTSFQNYTDIETLFINNSEDTTDVLQNELKRKSYNDNMITDTDIPNIEGNKIKRSEKKIIDETKQDYNTTCIDKVAAHPYIEIEVEDIKNYKEHTCNIENNMVKSTNAKMPILTSYLNNQSFVNYTQDKDSELMCINKDDNKYNVIVIDDENEYRDDASVNMDDGSDDHHHSPQKKTKMKKKTHYKLANTDFSDEDFDDDESNINKINVSDREDYTIDTLISTEKIIISKLESMNKSLDSIFENWEVTSLLTDLKTAGKQTKEELKKRTHAFLTKRKTLHSGRLRYVKKLSVLAKLGHLSADLDSINEMCVKTVEDYKIGLRGPKERLKAKLETWGELKAKDGYVFDKDTIINCIDKVSDRLLQRLLTSMDGKKHLSPGAVKILKMIPGKLHSINYESMFDIEYLTTEKDKLEEFERRKTYDCYVNAAFKCEICYQGFTTEGYLEYHKKAHDESRQFCCRICHVRHIQKSTRSTHMNSHNVVYKCKLCPLVTYYRGSMINHYEQHKGTIYKCEKCSKTYKSKSVYLTHQSHAHPRGDHICTMCGGAYFSQHGLKTHMLTKHRGELSVPAGSGFSCEECTLTFPSEEACLKHLRVTHAGHKTKHTYPALTRNLRKKPAMTCSECKTVGIGYGWLLKHYNTEHPSLNLAAVLAKKQKYLCDICGKGFMSKYVLREHIGYHAGVTFPCATCGKQFGSRQKLFMHRLMHGPRGYCCERCGKKFRTPSTLCNHMRIHTGDRSYKCHICGKGFLNSSALTKHVNGVHNHIRYPKKPAAKRTRGLTD